MNRQKPLLGQLPDWTRFPRPVGLWLMNEGSGNIVQDLSGNKNAGAFVNHTSWTAGRFGPALIFDGTDDYVLLESMILLGSGPLSFVVWFTTNELAYTALLGDTTDGNTQLLIYSSTAFRFRTAGGATSFTVPTMSTGVLYCVAATRDAGGNVRMYLDGVESSSGSQSNAGDFDVNTIGKGGSYYKNGTIALTHIFPSLLSAEKIARLCREPFPWFAEDEVSHLYVPGGAPAVKPWWYYQQMTSVMRRTG